MTSANTVWACGPGSLGTQAGCLGSVDTQGQGQRHLALVGATPGWKDEEPLLWSPHGCYQEQLPFAAWPQLKCPQMLPAIPRENEWQGNCKPDVLGVPLLS